jgi:recombination protein RecR
MALNYPSRLLEEAINEFAKLPGIGQKTALRLVLHLLRQDPEAAESFGNAVIKLRKEIKHCKICHNLSDFEVCHICSDPNRDRTTICVVENIRDVMSIENTHQFKGVYHVLGGIISPMEGIGPGDLTIHSLEERVGSKNSEIKEIILALPTTMEGDTTNFYIFRKLKDSNIRISAIARGVAIGDDLEYADEITLGRSILNRTDFEMTLKH